MFRGSTKVTTIMACLEFTFASWHFARVTPLHQLDTEHFLEFICRAENRKDTKNLRAYLLAKKFSHFYTQEAIVRPKDKRVTMVQPYVDPQSSQLESDVECVTDPEQIRQDIARLSA